MSAKCPKGDVTGFAPTVIATIGPSESEHRGISRLGGSGLNLFGGLGRVAEIAADLSRG